MSGKNAIKSVLESLMFVWGEPLPARETTELLNISLGEALDCFRELQKEYETQGRGIRIREIEQSFQFVTCPDNCGYIERFCTPVREKYLSQAAMEVLAIVAYKQPVTKGEIESVRGIRCDRVIEGLTKKELVEEVGRSQGIGRPILYGTTRKFLEHFDLSTIKDLPEIEDIESVLQKDESAGAEEFQEYQQISIEMGQ